MVRVNEIGKCRVCAADTFDQSMPGQSQRNTIFSSQVVHGLFVVNDFFFSQHRSDLRTWSTNLTTPFCFLGKTQRAICTRDRCMSHVAPSARRRDPSRIGSNDGGPWRRANLLCRPPMPHASAAAAFLSAADIDETDGTQRSPLFPDLRAHPFPFVVPTFSRSPLRVKNKVAWSVVRTSREYD